MQEDFEQAIHAHRKLAADRQRSEEVQLHRARVGAVKRPILWRELLARIKGIVNVDEGLLAPSLAINMKIAPDRDSFVLDHPSWPKARVKAIFQGALLIEVHCSYQKTDSAIPIEWEDRIEFSVDDLDRVSFQHHGEDISQDDAARLILAPVRDPKFRPPKTEA
jgi:hypothetical protein